MQSPAGHCQAHHKRVDSAVTDQLMLILASTTASTFNSYEAYSEAADQLTIVNRTANTFKSHEAYLAAADQLMLTIANKTAGSLRNP